MLTPAIAVEIGSSRIVVWRAQPPSSRRMWLSEKDHFRFGIVPWSVAGGEIVKGSCASRGAFLGPMIGAPFEPRSGTGAICGLD